MKVEIPDSIPLRKVVDFARDVDCQLVRTRDGLLKMRPRSEGNVVSHPGRAPTPAPGGDAA